MYGVYLIVSIFWCVVFLLLYIIVKWVKGLVNFEGLDDIFIDY